MRKLISFDETAKLVISELKNLGPGSHEIIGPDFVKIISEKRKLINKNHPAQWKPVIQIIKNIMGNNIIIPEGRFSKKLVIKVLNSEPIQKDKNKIISLTYFFNTLANENKRGNLLVISGKEIEKQRTSVEELLQLINFLGIKESTIVPDGTGKFNIQGFNAFMKALRAEENKIQSEKRKETIDALLNEEDDIEKTPLYIDLVNLFKSYNPIDQRMDPNLITPRILKFWYGQPELCEIKLPDKDKNLLRRKKDNTPVSIQQTWKDIKFILKNNKLEENLSGFEKRAIDFMTFNFLHVTTNIAPIDVSIKSINKKELIYTVTIINTNLDQITNLTKDFLEKKDISISNVNIDFKNNKTTFDVIYVFSSDLEYNWLITTI